MFEFNQIGVYVRGSNIRYIQRIRLHYQQYDRIQYHLKQTKLVFFHRFPQLADIEIWNCKSINDSGIKFIAKHNSHLERIVFRNCRNITNKGIQHIPRKVKSVALISCMSITDACIKLLPPAVEHINLTCCWYVEDRGLKNLSKLKQLKKLVLRRCNYLSEKAAFYVPTTVKICDFSWVSSFSNESLKEIAKRIPELEELYISGCQEITDAGLHLLSFLTKLKVLDLSKCYGISDEGLENLPDSLVKLSLEDLDSISDKGIKYIPRKRLKFLNIKNTTKLSDLCLRHIPKTVRILKAGGKTKITTIGLSDLVENKVPTRVIQYYDVDKYWTV